MATSLKSAILVSMAILMPLVIGCNGPSDSSNGPDLPLLEIRLAQALLNFQNAEESFGPSTNSDDLVRNAHWLERMVAEFREVEEIESEVLAVGQSPLTDLKVELAQRFRRHATTFESDARYVGVMHQFEIAKIWLDL